MKPNKKRLLNVAKALRESKSPRDFTMDKYVHGCGTPACALGHYASRTDLQKVFLAKPDDDDTEEGLFVLKKEANYQIGYDTEEVLQHFGLDYNQSQALFGTRGCDNARCALSAAVYIEEWVEENCA